MVTEDKIMGRNIKKYMLDGHEVVECNNLTEWIEWFEKTNKNIKIKAQTLGGFMRRSATFDIQKGTLFYSEGDEDEKQLWAADEQPCPGN